MRSPAISMESRPDPVNMDRAAWALVMVQAVKDLGQPGELLPPREALIRHQTMEWFRSTRTEVGSFRWICSELDLPADRYLAKVEAGDYNASVVDMGVESPDRIQQAMERHGVSVTQAAEELGMCRETFWTLASGRVRRSRYALAVNEYISRLEAQSPC